MRTRLLLLGGQALALGLMTAFLVVPVSALFLDEYGAGALPYTYLAVAGAGVAVSWTMTRAQLRLSLARLAEVVIGAYLLAVGAGWLVLVAADGLWVTFPLLVLFPVSIPVGFVVVGSQAGRLLDVRQMKARFPRVAACFAIGFALGGLLAAGLVVPLGGPRHLLGLCVLAAVAMLGMVRATAAAFPDELRASPHRAGPDGERADRRAAWRELRSNRLVALLLGYQVLSAAVTQLLDFILWERAAARYPDPSALTQFQGLFGALMNVTSVLFVVVAAGWLLTRFGVGFGLAANPAGVLVLLVATTLTGYLTGSLAVGFFVLVCAQAVTDISLTDGTTRASVNATYQALRPDERLRAQTVIEGAGVPTALGLVGLLLIGYDALGLDILAVVVMTLLLTALWLTLAVLGYREYGLQLRESVGRPAWDPVTLRLDDATSYVAVDQLLASTDLDDVHAGLEALADSGIDLTERLVALLVDDDPARRALALKIAVRTRHLELPAVLSRAEALLRDGDPDVALHAAAALSGLGSPRREAGRSAWLAALATGDPTTVHRALAAAAELPDGFFAPYLLELASTADTSTALLDALEAHCDHLAPLVGGLLADSSVSRLTRERVIHFLGKSATAEARDLLVANLDGGDPAIVDAAALCLVAAGHRETHDRLDLTAKLVPLADRVGRCLEVLSRLDDRLDHQPLRWALRDEIDRAARRAGVLLELVHDPRAVATAVSTLAAPDERSRGVALEMLEVTLGHSMAETTFALVDAALDDHTRRRLLARHCQLPERSLGEWLRALVRDDDGYWHDPWLRACALYAVPSELPGGAAADLVRPFLDDPDPDVAETARWVRDRWVEPERVGLDLTP